MYAFHVEVPAGATALDVEFQYLTPQNKAQGRVVMTPEMLNLQWNAVSLYPAGYYASRIKAQASVKLSAGWQAARRWKWPRRDGDTVSYKPIDYDDLVDSPIYAGKYFKRVDLDPGANAPVHLNIVADDPKYLEINARAIEGASQPGAADVQDVRRAPLRPLRLPVLAERQDERQRPGASPLQRERRRPEYFTEWDKNGSQP